MDTRVFSADNHILNDYGRTVWREGRDSITVPQDGNISSCNTVAMFSSPSIALFFVKLSVGLKEWMNKGKKAHNLPLHGPLTQGNLCAFYTEKNDAVYPVFRSFPAWDPQVFIGTFGFGEPS